jgi:hypothetical protein
LERASSVMMVTLLLRWLARLLVVIIGDEALVQFFPANLHFLFGDGLYDSTAEIGPYFFEIFSLTIHVNEDLVQAHEFLCSLILTEARGS